MPTIFCETYDSVYKTATDLTKVKYFTTQTIFNVRYFVNIAKKD